MKILANSSLKKIMLWKIMHYLHMTSLTQSVTFQKILWSAGKFCLAPEIQLEVIVSGFYCRITQSIKLVMAELVMNI